MPTQEDLLGAWGATLQRLREEQHMSQYRLAQLSRVDTRHIDRIERGLVNAGDINRLMIAGALGVEVSDIWRYPPAPAPTFDVEVEPDEASGR